MIREATILVNRSNMFFYYENDQKTTAIIQELQPLVERNNFQVVTDHSEANIIVSIGSDGVFLQAVRESGFRQDAIYVGVTLEDMSTLYCDFHLDDFNQLIQIIKNKEIEVRRFPLIKVRVNEGVPFYCLNEVTIRSTIVKTIVLDVYIDNKLFETFRGDGMVVATPTGSTAYNKSNRGAVIDPLIPCFQVSEIASMNNNNYRTLGSSFVLDKNRVLRLVEIEDGNDHPIISFDNEAYPIRQIDNVEVSMDDKVIKIVKLKDNSYWDRVKRMFLN